MYVCSLAWPDPTPGRPRAGKPNPFRGHMGMGYTVPVPCKPVPDPRSGTATQRLDDTMIIATN